MSFRERMRVQVSRAEMMVLNELVRRRLTRNLETQKGFQFILHMDAVAGTTVDFYWNAPYRLAAFVDGVKVQHGYPKLHLRHGERDDKITEALRNRGIKVLRFPYEPPLSKSKLMEISDQIEEALRIG